MNAQEIINELASGKTVSILSDDAFWFMREVEHHKISCDGVVMTFAGGQCVMVMETRYYCPEHQYSPPDNSGFALCPQCEIAAAEHEENRIDAWLEDPLIGTNKC